jgi:hypothetical protein
MAKSTCSARIELHRPSASGELNGSTESEIGTAFVALAQLSNPKPIVRGTIFESRPPNKGDRVTFRTAVIDAGNRSLRVINCPGTSTEAWLLHP